MPPKRLSEVPGSGAEDQKESCLLGANRVASVSSSIGAARWLNLLLKVFPNPVRLYLTIIN